MSPMLMIYKRFFCAPPGLVGGQRRCFESTLQWLATFIAESRRVLQDRQRVQGGAAAGATARPLLSMTSSTAIR
jgi:hypothetical protein